MGQAPVRYASPDCNAYNGAVMPPQRAVTAPGCVRPLASALAAAALAGCAGNQAAYGGGAAPAGGAVVIDGGLHASVSFSIGSTAANVLAAGAIIGFLAAANERSPVAPLREDRTINEQDCTQPLANRLANLKCR
jgi:hypothetical protein